MNLRIAKKIMKHVHNGDVKPSYNKQQIDTARRIIKKRGLIYRKEK